MGWKDEGSADAVGMRAEVCVAGHGRWGSHCSGATMQEELQAGACSLDTQATMQAEQTTFMRCSAPGHVICARCMWWGDGTSVRMNAGLLIAISYHSR